MSSKSISGKINALKSRTVNVTASTSTVPDPSTDFLTSFRANTATRTDISNDFTIDLLPNMIATTCYIIAMCAKYEHDLNKLGHAKMSFPSLVYYCHVLLYGFYLVHDLHVRPAPSEYASTWLESKQKFQFAEHLLSLPVPAFMETIFAQLTAAESERRANIHVIPSFAGFTHRTHFGTFIPPSFFLALHNVLADIAATDKATIMTAVLSATLYTITTPKTSVTTAYNATPLDFLGGTIENTNDVSFLDSKWYQFFDSLFNPVLFRSQQRRDHLAAIPFTAPKFATPASVNPYDLLFFPTRTSIAEQTVVTSAIASLFKGIVPFSKDLLGIITTSSGIASFTHGYSKYALPVTNYDLSTIPTKIAKITRTSPSDYATSIRFLVQPTASTTNNRLDVPAIQKDDGTPVTTGYKIVNLTHQIWNRLLQTDTTTDYPPATAFELYSDYHHLFPKVFVFSLESNVSVDAYLATLTGKIIETIDIDGQSVAHPDTRAALGAQNALFADSAFPYSMTYPRSAFSRSTAVTSRAIALSRSLPKPQSRHAASTLLVDRTQITLPRYEPTTNENLTGLTLFPGLTPVTNVVWPTWALRFIGFHTPDHSNNAEVILPNTTKKIQRLVWSPYSFTSAYDEDSLDQQDPLKTRRYFLLNLRTIFGTDVPLAECKHQFESLPVH